MDSRKREALAHGQDIMRSLNSVSTVMVAMTEIQIHANVTVQSGSEEEKTRKEIELTLGTNLECGHLLQRLMKLFFLDAIDTHLEMFQD